MHRVPADAGRALRCNNQVMNKSEFDKEVGKYFLDVSKLILGGVVLATIIKIEDINKLFVLLLGIIAAIGFALYGFMKIKNKN